MQRLLAVACVCAVSFSIGCFRRETIPETGRRRAALQYSEADMAVLGANAFTEVEKKYKTITGTKWANAVTRVGSRIAKASGKNYEWEFRLFDAPKTINAFCLPGGKIGVFSGILPIAQDDDGLAIILGHEVAHATLQHANERMSEPVLKKLIGLPVGIVVGTWGALEPHSRKAVMSGLGLGMVVGELMPYNQQMEVEADDVGLVYTKKAGYDYKKGPALWRRMAAESKGQVSDSVSSHPDPEARAERMERHIQQMD